MTDDLAIRIALLHSHLEIQRHLLAAGIALGDSIIEAAASQSDREVLLTLRESLNILRDVSRGIRDARKLGSPI